MSRTYCNPLNIPYQYQHYGKNAHREAADPTLLFYQGKYYLYASMSEGFYDSDDLLHWQYHRNENLDKYRYAPDVREVNGSMIFCASTRGKPSTFWRTKDPYASKYEKVSEPFDFWDPDLFQDDDGRVYLYWGCDSGRPIYGIELDPDHLTPIGDKKELIFGDMEHHGFERHQYPGAPKQKLTLGMKLLYFMMKISGHGGENAPFIEGAYMNKFGGKYYLQYASPATEVSTYGDGVYVGESPLGPFVYQSWNPMSLKPGGFMTGAGHGSTIKDQYGNLWHASTMRISVNANFERRVGLFPAGIDKDGILFCNQSFSDYPLSIPEGRFDPWSIRPKWMLLSYRKKAKASGSLPGHAPSLAFNEDVRSWWCANQSEGAWLEVDLGKTEEIHAVQINLADEGVPVKKVPRSQRSDITTSCRWIDSDPARRTRWALEESSDGQNWSMLIDKSKAETDLSHDYIELQHPVHARFLRLTSVQLPYGEKFAVSGLRVFGISDTPLPEQIRTFSHKTLDAMTEELHWDQKRPAIGAEVRYGIAPDKLYASFMTYGTDHVILSALNSGQPLWARIDAFSEGGITEGKAIQIRY